MRSKINEAVKIGAADGIGQGEAIGKMIETEKFPYRDISPLAGGFRNQVPVTVHVSLAAISFMNTRTVTVLIGETSYTDFLI